MAKGHNDFIWYELMTTDQPAAEAFYRAVVGWEMADAGQPGMRYTILSAGKRDVGGLMALPAEACAAGAKPSWIGYIGVADTDAAAKRIAKSGGSIHRGPDDIPNVGRFAVVADPGGATFTLLTPLPREQQPQPVELPAAVLGPMDQHPGDEAAREVPRDGQPLELPLHPGRRRAAVDPGRHAQPSDTSSRASTIAVSRRH